MEQRPLFGGAMTCDIPSAWRDVSNVRQVPDHQECWHDIDGGRMLVIEILERKGEVADKNAAAYFFQDLAEANACDTANYSFSNAQPPVNGAAVIPNLAAAAAATATVCCLGSGYQRVALGRAMDMAGNPRQQEVRIIHVDLAVLRLPLQNTDLLITLSSPSEFNPQQAQEHAVSEPFRQILSSFQIRDWGLFL